MSEVAILAEGLSFPEGPAFDAKGRLWAVELKGEALVCLDKGELTLIPVGGRPNGLTLDAQDRVYFCDSGHNAIRRYDPAQQATESLLAAVVDTPLNMPNDLAFDPAGTLVFTCPGQSREEPTGYLCARTPDGQASCIAAGFYFPNGLAFSPDGSELVVAETYRQRIWRGRWDAATASWIKPQVWATGLEGPPGPDGMAFAEDGTLFVAVYGSSSIVHLDAAGHILERIPLPGANPTNCAFDPTGALGLVVTEAQNGRLLSLARPERGCPLNLPALPPHHQDTP